MLKFAKETKGVALLVILCMLFVVAALAAIILNSMLSQSRLTHHQISRIQAYYANLAGINYAMDKLRTGVWAIDHCPAPPALAPDDCTMKFDPGDFRPASIRNNSVRIILIPRGSQGCQNAPVNTNCISVLADYTYTNP